MSAAHGLAYEGGPCPHCRRAAAEPGLEVISRPPVGAPRSAPPLLFVHGGWHSAQCYDEFFLPHFAALGYDCHALSLRGHGRSEGHERMRRHRVADFVRDLCRVASRLAEPPVLIAHSFGGFVAAHYLRHHRPAAVALLAPVPPTGLWSVTKRWAMAHPVRFALANLTANPRLMIDDPRLAKEFLFSDAMADERVRRFHATLGNESYLAFLDGLFLDLPARPHANCPMVVIGAEHDRLIGMEDNRITAGHFGAELRMLPGLAHDVMLEDGWATAVDALQRFVEGVARGR